MSKKHKGIILKLRESRAFKGVVALVLLNFLFELVQPSVSLALTEGPSQPEVQSFEPISTNQMVNLFTGDFNYNIPLMNVPGPNGGYPINIAYNAGISMDDEASWVGLGWNINPGSLVRNKRGLPDEFSSETEDKNWSGGDFIYTKSDMRESWTIGLQTDNLFEVFGLDQLAENLELSASLRYNSYNGLGMSLRKEFESKSSPWSLGVGLDSDNGLGVDASTSFTQSFKKQTQNFDLSISFDGNLSLNYSTATKYNTSRDSDGSDSHLKDNRVRPIGSGLSFARNNFSPSIGRDVNNYSLSLGFTITSSPGPGVATGLRNKIFYNTQDYKNKDKNGIKRPVMGYASADSRTNNGYYTKDFVRENDGQITKESAVLPSSYYAFDSYFSSGQGLSGFFRVRRNDVGSVHDVQLRTETLGASYEMETPSPITFPLSHTGLGVAVPFGWDNQGRWSSADALSTTNELAFGFNKPEDYDIRETHYYKVHGEQTMKDESSLNYVNSTDLALATFEPKSGIYTAKRRIKQSTNNHFYNNREFGDSEREVRNTLVHSLKNKEVAGIGEFDIKHYEFDGSIDYTSQPLSLNREIRNLTVKDKKGNSESNDVSIDNHNAGFKVLNEEGAYYVYGLPAYNKKEVQNLFSIDGDETDNFDPVNTNIVDIQSLNNMVDYKAQGSHKFIDKNTTSPYPHSYLLTSVQGADYVDVTNNGPTDDDLGHWVKFDYVKYADDYKWRAPYAGANFSDGQSYTRQDDKGSYQFGEKEIWYVGRIETKTHIAIFELEERQDNLEAESELINVDDLGSNLNDNKSGLKVSKIKLYKKQDFQNDPINATPIKTVHFEYDYSLCKGIPNSLNSGGGKLTLKKVWFTYQNSERGNLSPYVFDYTNVNLPAHLQHLNDNTNNHFNYINPDYFYNAYDPWGNFKPYEGLNSDPMSTQGYGTHSNFSYVNQTPNGWEQSWMANTYSGPDATEFNREVTKEVNDLLASTWSLRSITLPSGGTINIDYESDDYSHVQHKVANQMFKIVKLGDFTDPDEIYTGGNEDFNDESSVDDEYRRRIYFKLEKPIQTGLTDEIYADSIYRDYVEPLMQDESGQRNLYFKSRMRLTFNSNKEVYDYVRGYLPIENNLTKVDGGDTHFNFGVLKQDVNEGDGVSAKFMDNGTEYYSVGYITIQPGLKKNGDYFNKYHPMALTAWTYMQSSAPQLLNPASIQSSEEPENAGDIAAMFTNIFNVVPQTASSFGFIRAYCKSKNFAQFIDLENSGIRLASPDKIKYGGGHRVKSVSITDNWSADANGENSRTYGQDYDYTTKDEYGNTISSGVAQYEPQAGGDENALKYPIHFYGKNKLFTNNNLFTEMPINESLFPGAQVGYRKVTVTSINTREQIKNKAQGDPTRGRTGGLTIHEFYTAKDFPTIIDYSVLSEENDTKSAFNVPIPIPFIGSIKRNYYHGSQAFKIELNDMHGKPRSVKTFETNNYEVNSDPITENTFEYRCKPIVYQKEQVKKLINKVDVIPKNNADLALGTTQKLMGVDVDLFTDQREHKSFWNEIGLDFNVDIVLPPSFVPSLWPSYNNNKSLFRTYVTNKVVHRSGILKKSISRDLQTVNESEVIAYDEKSGNPIITKVKNEFGDSFYKSDLPAYYQYDKMGHAYQNINYTVAVTAESVNVDQSGEGTFLRFSIAGSGFENVFDHLVRGDEVLLQGISLSPRKEAAITLPPTNGEDRKKAYYLGTEYTDQGTLIGVLHFPFGLNTNINSSNYEGLEGSYSITNVFPVIKVIRSGRRNHYSQVAASYSTKDLITPNNNQVDVGEGSHVVAVDEIDGVLSASASLFKDNWLTRATDLSWDGAVENPYLSGNSGIWRPYKSYTYAGERNTQPNYTLDNNSSDPDLREDGLMDNVPMFTWKIGNIEDDDDTKNWEWVNEITRFSPDAYEIENRNRLDIHSSALYGYDNSLTIGVGGNAEVREIGVFDFEMSSEASMTFSKQLNQTNLNFDNSHDPSSLMNIHQCDIEKATIDGSNLIKVVTDIPFNQFDISDFEQNVGLTLTSEEGTYKGNEGFFLNGMHDGSVTEENGLAVISVNPFIDNINANNNLVANSQYHGKVSLLSESNFIRGPLNASYTTEFAHTGEQAMEVNGQAMFDQPRLKLKKDKKYVLSVWVSRENTNVVSYEVNDLVELGSVTNGVFDPNGINTHDVTYGKIIEGWQKVDIELSAPLNNLVLGIQFNPGVDKLFVDDIRFSPKTGGITTYVYGASDLWLRAELNADNYATLYYYDEEGNLTLKKQETEEGIFTVTESRGHVSED